jgi:pre-rRNA-processing protein TSR3|tara:strand:+ start:1192 stop:1686 length:495 start_codon:yes stop_codon:yes gene_type:complete
MKLNVLMFNQDDPKKCTAAKLLRFGLVKKITKISSTTLLLHPYAKKTLLSSDKNTVRSITGIDCSWNYADNVFEKKFNGISRKLPPLLAGNPVNYSKLNKLTTVEAISSAAFLLGYETLSHQLMEKFNWGHTFFELNENLLNDYQNAISEEEIRTIIREYGYQV